jgi:hypothetical protein
MPNTSVATTPTPAPISATLVMVIRPGVISVSNMPGPLAAFSAAAPPRSTAVSSFSPTLTGRDTCLPFEYTASTM